MFKLLGVLPTYNDGDCIQVALRAMLLACQKVHVWDHGSTDSTYENVAALMQSGAAIEYHKVSRTDIPIKNEKGRFSFAFWQHVAAWTLTQTEYDWVYWGDADELLRTDTLALPRRIDFEIMARRYDAIEPLFRQFAMTEKDADATDIYYKRMHYYFLNTRVRAARAWKLELTPTNMPAGAHIQSRESGPLVFPHFIFWPQGTKVSIREWYCDAYQFRTHEQSRSRMFREGRVLMDGGPRYRRLNRTGYIKASEELTLNETELEFP